MNKALEVLRSGGIILYPTDTVWGIGCDATDENAVRKVFQIKKRSDSKSLVLLAADMDMVAEYVNELPFMAAQLVEVNDKPMTIIYPGAIVQDAPTKQGLAPSCVAEDGSVGIRVPMANEFVRSLLERFGKPIVSTSANISGEATPRSFGEISEDILQAVDFVVDRKLEADSTGRSSQIISLGLGGEVKIIRP